MIASSHEGGRESRMCRTRGRSTRGIKAFGRVSVRGRSLLPKPPATITSCIRSPIRGRGYVFSGLAFHFGTIVTTLFSRASHVWLMERTKSGEVFRFFGYIGVAAIKLTDGSLAVGDTVQIQGPTTNLEQPVDSLQIEHGAVSNAALGQEVGMKVRDRVREKDFVYKLVGPSEAAPAPKTAARKPVAKKAPPKKGRPKTRTETKRAAKKRP